MSDHCIQSLRTLFASANGAASAVTFAQQVLLHEQQTISRIHRSGQLMPRRMIALLGVKLHDPARPAPADRDVYARVEQGRWLADCECGGAEYVDLELPLFMCCNDWNRADEHKWRRVVLPADRERIEQLLLARPNIENRNWRPRESVEDLEAENVAHGVAA